MTSRQELESFLENKVVKFVQVGQKCKIMIVIVDGTELYTSIITDFESHFFEDVEDVFNYDCYIYSYNCAQKTSCKLSLTNDIISVDLEFIYKGKKVLPFTEKLTFKLEKKATVDSDTLLYDFMDVKQRLKRKRIFEEEEEYNEEEEEDNEEEDYDEEEEDNEEE